MLVVMMLMLIERQIVNITFHMQIESSIDQFVNNLEGTIGTAAELGSHGFDTSFVSKCKAFYKRKEGNGIGQGG